MRNSWKTVARNVVEFLSKEQATRALKHYLTLWESSPRGEEKDAALRTVQFLTKVIEEFDREGWWE